jgi:hypothetical protein
LQRGDVPNDKRQKLLADAITLLDEARAVQPHNQPLLALRRLLTMSKLSSALFKDRAIAIRAAEELINLNSSDAELTEAAAEFARVGPGQDKATEDITLRLLREALRLESTWPDLQEKKLRFWRERTKDLDAGHSAVKKFIDDFDKPEGGS